MCHIGNREGPLHEAIIERLSYLYDFACGEQDVLCDIGFEELGTRLGNVEGVRVAPDGFPYLIFGPTTDHEAFVYYFDGTDPLRTLHGDIMAADGLCRKDRVALYREDKPGHWAKIKTS